MSKRKTVDVSYIVEKANYFLANSEDEQTKERSILATFTECLLHKADQYKGFNYLPSQLETFADGYTQLKPGYDDTRRYYYG